VQIVYEHNVRPPDKLHAPWLERVEAQMGAALKALDVEVGRERLPADEGALTQAGLCAAIAWRFMQIKPDMPVSQVQCPALAALSARVEAFPAFLATPAIETANVSTPGYRAP
jgi:glutathione S-transferase